MNKFIYGAWKTGSEALHRIKDKYGDDINGFIDTKKRGSYNGYPIIAPSKIPEEAVIIFAHDNIIIAAEMYGIIRNREFKDIYWFMNLSDDVKERMGFLENECFKINNWGNCVLPNMEIHISDKCNLNCKNCTHFSPLFTEIGVDFDRCVDDVRLLKSKFSNIGRLDILGGEPLLNPSLDKYVSTFRELLPDTYLNIFTNGLLIPELADKVLETIKDCETTVTISEYPPVSKIIDKIVTRLSEVGVRYRITSFRGNFNVPITTSEKTVHPLKCISDGCVCVSDGKLSRCPTLMYVYKFNEVFGTNLPEDGLIPLNDCPKGEELLKLLRRDVPLCRYCIECGTQWSVCGKERRIDDFAVRD